MTAPGSLRSALSGALRPVVYVRFDAERVHAIDPRSQAEFDELPIVAFRERARGPAVVAAVGREAEALAGPDIRRVNPFSHERVVVHEFEAARALFGHVLRRVRPPRPLVRPHAVVQPLRALAGGLSDVEERALVEALVSAGARSASVHLHGEAMPEVEGGLG